MDDRPRSAGTSTGTGSRPPSRRGVCRCLIWIAVISPTIVSADEGEKLPSEPMAPTNGSYMETVYREELKLVDAYDEHTKDPKELREKAHDLLIAVRRTSLGLPAEMNRVKMYLAAHDLMEKGARDPMIVAIAMQMQPFIVKADEMSANCKTAIEDALKIYPPRQQIEVINRCQDVQLALYNKYRRQRKYPLPDWGVKNEAYARWIASQADSLQQQRRIWVIIDADYLHNEPVTSVQLVDVAQRTEDKKIHPWMRHMLDGHHAQYDAHELIAKRKDGADVFFRKAAEQFQAAWEIEPKFPEPATELILLARDGYAEGAPQQWFEKAVAAEFDHHLAYRCYRTCMRGRGADALIRFGTRCAATKRYDTTVPFELLECLWTVENTYGENAWSREGIYEQVRDLLQGALKAPKYLGEPHNDQTRAWLNAMQIVLAARANRLDEIPPLWEKTDTASLTRAAKIFKLKTPLPALKAAAQTAADEPTRLVNVVEKAIDEAHDEASIAAAAQQAKAAAAILKSDDSRVGMWNAILALKRDFYADRTAEIVFPENFVKLSGVSKWSRIDEHTLECRGSEKLPLPRLADLPPPYELTFEMETISMPERALAGLQLGNERPLPDQGGQGRYFGLNSKTKQAAMRDYVVMYYPMAHLKDANIVRIRAFYGHFEFYVNEDRVAAYPAGDFDPTGYAALLAPSAQFAKPVVRFSRLQVRRLAFEPPHRRMTAAERIEYFTKRIADEPENLFHYLDRGDARLKAGQPKQALADFQHLVEKRKDWDFAHLKLGVARAANGDYQAAIDSYQRAVELTPDAANAYDRWAWLEATCPDEEFRNGKQAVEHAQRAIALNKNRKAYQLTLAAALAEQGDFPAAKAALRSAGQFINLPQQALVDPMRKAIDRKQPYRDE